MGREQPFLFESTGRRADSESLRGIGEGFQESGRIAAFVMGRGPHTEIRLIPEHGFTLDVKIFMDSTVSVTRVIPLGETKSKRKRNILRRGHVPNSAVIKLLEKQLPLPKKTA